MSLTVVQGEALLPLASPRQVAGVWKLLGLLAYGVEVEAPSVVRLASKLISAVMADTAETTPFDSASHFAKTFAKYEDMANAGSMGGKSTRQLTQEEREAKPEFLAEQERIAKRWDDKTEGVVRIKRCKPDHVDPRTGLPVTVPGKFRMVPPAPDMVVGPRCHFCNRPIAKGIKIVWARLVSMIAPMSYRPYSPMPPSAVCPNCVPALTKEISDRERKASEQGRRAANVIVYGYDAG